VECCVLSLEFGMQGAGCGVLYSDGRVRSEEC
jgi:hypothetical protein